MPIRIPDSSDSEPDDHEHTPSVEEVVNRLDRLWSDTSVGTLSPFASLAGTQVGSYIVERVIGRGTFGIVYKARDERLQRDVALKVPRPEVLLDGDQLRRFQSEAQATAMLDHPAIVRLFEADLSGAVPYLASAWCPGPNLQQWLDEAKKTPPIRIVAEFVTTMADAVQHAHEAGIIHRDLKPGNILLSPRTEDVQNTELGNFDPKLADFGLSRISRDEMQVTQTGMKLGTPLYMSPEQVAHRPERNSPATDIYALGVLLYQLLTGRPPFKGDTEFEMLQQILLVDPVSPTLSEPTIPQDLSSICLKCLEKDPQQRYISAETLRADLQRYLDGKPTQARPVSAAKRIFRWAKRFPAAAALVAGSILACVVTIFGLSFHLQTVRHQAGKLTTALADVSDERAMALAARRDAEMARDIATVAQERAEKHHQTAQMTSYQSDMRLAFEMMNEGRWHDVDNLLNRQIPDDDAADLREMEWTVLQAELQAKWQETGHHDGAATDCVLAEDGSLALSCGVDGVVRRCDLATGENLTPLEPGIGELHAMALSPDGNTLAVGGSTGLLDTAEVKLMDVRTGDTLSSLQSHSTTIESIAFSPDGRWLAAGSRYQPVQLTRLSDEKTFTLPAERRNRTVSFSPDSAWLAVAATFTHNDLWPVDGDEPGEPVRRVASRNARPYLVRFTQRRSILATAFVNRDIVTLHEYPGHSLEGIAYEGDSHSLSARLKSLAFSPLELRLAAGDEAGSIVWWNLPKEVKEGNTAKLRPDHACRPHQATVSSLQFVDENRVISTGEDGRVCVSDPLAHSGTFVRWDRLLVNAVIENDGRLLLGCEDGTIRTVGIKELLTTSMANNESSNALPPVVARLPSAVLCLSRSPAGDVVAAGTHDGAALLLDSQTFDIVETLTHAQPNAVDVETWHIGFSGDGNRLAFSSGTGFVTVVDRSGGQHPMKHFARGVSPFAFINNDQEIVVKNGEECLNVIQVDTGHMIRTLPGKDVNELCVSPDGKLLACGLYDGRMRLCSLDGGESHLVNSHLAAIESAVFSASGQTLVSIDQRRRLRFTSVGAGASFGEVVLSATGIYHSDGHVLLTDSWLVAICEIEHEPERGISSTECRIWKRETKSEQNLDQQ